MFILSGIDKENSILDFCNILLLTDKFNRLRSFFVGCEIEFGSSFLKDYLRNPKEGKGLYGFKS